MNNFKAIYDALVTQYEIVNEIAQSIEELFAENKIDDALVLEPTLNDAQAKAAQIGDLYRKLTEIDNDVASYFVPASDPDPEEDADKPLTRAEFDRLKPVDKAAYMAGGGIIQDEE